MEAWLVASAYGFVCREADKVCVSWITVIKQYFEHPLTRELDLNNPRTTHLRRRIIKGKSFLRQIYQEWYEVIGAALPEQEGPVLELGSGAGFMSEYIPGLITTEVFYCPNITVVLDGQRLPFVDGSLRGIVMTDVLHHLPRAREFFTEATRCIKPGGVIAMIEPWVSNWSRLCYKYLHHEPFSPDATEWEFSSSGPLSDSNSALPWIMLERDRGEFEREFPMWQIQIIRPFMPFRYLISGGVSLRSMMPGWSFGFWRMVERLLTSYMERLGMFALIVLKRKYL
jgi:SAM-dependent methyltransferase